MEVDTSKDGALIVVTSLFGFLGGLWFAAWLFHVGPASGTNAPWWAFPYWFTSVLAGFAVIPATIFVVAFFYGLVRRSPTRP